MKPTQKSEPGFSLVEIAIVMVVIGLVVAAITVGKSTMQSANTMRAFKKVVEPCVAAVHEGIRNGMVPMMPSVATINLGSGDIGCTFTKSTVTVTNTTESLRHLMTKQISDGVDVLVKEATVTVYAPGVDDDDEDGTADGADVFALDSAEDTDTDEDGIGNNADTDDDGDGVEDSADAFPLNAAENTDTDGDGIGNNADTDDDGDGVEDSADYAPLDASVSEPPRFVDNGDGTITDNQTGLVGLKNANCFGRDRYYTTAISRVAAFSSGSCGLTDGSSAGDWRLVTRNELTILYDWKQSGKFSSVATETNARYWSSTRFEQIISPTLAYGIYINIGNVSDGGEVQAAQGSYLWPVRSP